MKFRTEPQPQKKLIGPIIINNHIRVSLRWILNILNYSATSLTYKKYHQFEVMTLIFKFWKTCVSILHTQKPLCWARTRLCVCVCMVTIWPHPDLGQSNVSRPAPEAPTCLANPAASWLVCNRTPQSDSSHFQQWHEASERRSPVTCLHTRGRSQTRWGDAKTQTPRRHNNTVG